MKASEHNIKLHEKRSSSNNLKYYHFSHELKIKKMLQLIDGTPEKILDIGCADGWFGELLKNKFNSEVHGIDIKEQLLIKAKERGLITKKFDLSANNWPYENNFFDLIIAGDIIEHIYDTENFVDECKRILKTNGQLIISVPNINAYHNRFFVLFGKMPLWIDFASNMSMYPFLPPLGHIRVFNKYSLRKLLQKYDLKIEKIDGACLKIIDTHIKKTLIKLLRLNYQGLRHDKLIKFLKLANKIEWIFSKFPTLATILIVKSRKID